ncbi:MAG: DAK2 domain-containing protein [Acidimicrobiia bacterium]|nr:MAG: DAK2 domain-containing protein [Acidimicrobiia bacterium]
MATRRALLMAQDLKAVMHRYLERLRQHRTAIDRLNVYPVPDGDTGTNMTSTVESVMAAADGAESMVEIAHAMAHGSLMGAQGNSGIILSQILRGLADAFGDQASLGTEQLVDALERASQAAYEAVGRPVEGTILTVLRAAAKAARAADTPAGEDLAGLMLRVYGRALQSLEETPELLPVLKQAGVVDAGGAGFLLLLAAFLEEVTGEEPLLPATIFRAAATALVVDPGGDDPEANLAGLRYEVMYLLHCADSDAGDRLREAWVGLGDSVVVVGGEGVWNCHIHTDHIGPAIEAGIGLGRPERIKVTDLLIQAAAEQAAREPDFEPLPGFAGTALGVVAVASGTGVVELFRQSGAQGIVAGGQTRNPSVREMLQAVERVPAAAVLLLPNNRNVIPAAEQVVDLTSKRVLVVPTRSVPEGLAAMFGFMPDGDPEVIAAAMSAAAARCAWGEVTQAVGDAITPAGRIAAGDWLGVVAGEVSIVAGGVAEAAIGVLDHLVSEECELVTVIEGEGATPEATSAIAGHLSAGCAAEVTVLRGGQPLYAYLLGVE